MSDRPSDLEFKMQHLVIAVKDLITEWYDLGLQLGLPDSTLRLIRSDPDIEGHLRMMLSKWLSYDAKASWEKLASALNTMGKNSMAANIRSKFVRTAATLVADVSDENKTSREMNRNILQKIKCQFASLQLEVRSAMEARQVKVSDVHQFLVASFQGDCTIPEAPDLTKLFNIITEAKLWSYDHYVPLQGLAEQFLCDDEQVRKHIADYRNQLSGFYTTTKIVDFINLSELDESEDDTQQPFSPEKYKKHYRRLKIKLKLDKKITGLTLGYVNTLWQSLAEEFDLPSLTAVLDKIVDGSLIITWLILPHIADKIQASSYEALRLYQRQSIVEIYIDDELIVGSTPLYQASFMGRTGEVKELLEGGADINEPNDDCCEETVLFGACQGGHAETARVLLDYGANVDYKNSDGESALHYASSAGETECVKVLLKYGAQVDLPDCIGYTALMEACRAGWVEIVGTLLNHGANVNHQDKRGWTGLMRASGKGYTDTVRVLLEAKADPNITDEDNETALHWAAVWGHVEVIKMLVTHGAAVDIRNKDGLTALDFARGGGDQAVCEVLEQYTKQETSTELTQEQRESIYQRLLKMLERTFLKEKVKKKEDQQKEKHHHQRKERVGGERGKLSLWSRLRGRTNRPGQIIGTAPSPEK